jgi:hypothetical protein
MRKIGVLLAQRRKNFGYCGDYYVLSSKKAMFSYVALSKVHSFALTKTFLFGTLLKKYPGLHAEMVSESFA